MASDTKSRFFEGSVVVKGIWLPGRRRFSETRELLIVFGDDFIHVYIYIYICIDNIYIYLSISIYLSIYLSIYIYIYIYIDMHIIGHIIGHNYPRKSMTLVGPSTVCVVLKSTYLLG